MLDACVKKERFSEVVVRGRGLGRHVCHDQRSREFPAELAERVSSVSHSLAGIPLNQEDHRCSTAHSLSAAIWGGSDIANPAIGESSALRIYAEATRLAGGEILTDREQGSSGLEACRAAQSLGLIDSYNHAFGIDEALRALTLQPVLTGFKWYSSFDDPDSDFPLVEVLPNSFVRGGHQVLAYRIDLDEKLVWFWNSWGRSFGDDGRFCMTFETWSALLEEDGDVIVPHIRP